MSIEIQRYEEHVEEAGWIADSYPRDEEQRLTQSWIDSINATLGKQRERYEELARLTRANRRVA